MKQARPKITNLPQSHDVKQGWHTRIPRLFSGKCFKFCRMSALFRGPMTDSETLTDTAQPQFICPMEPLFTSLNHFGLIAGFHRNFRLQIFRLRHDYKIPIGRRRRSQSLFFCPFYPFRNMLQKDFVEPANSGSPKRLWSLSYAAKLRSRPALLHATLGERLTLCAVFSPVI
jgi:hypothetical protein